MRRHCLLSLTMILLSIVGCDEREEELRTWQQKQVDQLQQQAQLNTEAARDLVAADAESRRQFVALEQSLQTERQQLSEQSTALETDRKELATARERVPLLATGLQGMAGLLLGIVALAVCGLLLRGLSTDDGQVELEETLILSVAGEPSLLAESMAALPAPLPSAAIDHQPEQPPDRALVGR